jgi:hypothetical protein
MRLSPANGGKRLPTFEIAEWLDVIKREKP